MGDTDQALPELEVRLLGEFDVTAAGRSIAPPGAKRRGLVAILALRANEVVPVERLVDGIWGEDPPPSAVNLVHTYVSLWRRLLDEHLGPGAGRARIIRVGAGYRLVLRQGELDLDECRRLGVLGRAAAEEHRWGEAATCFGRACEIWGSEVLVDLRGEPVRSGLGQLEQERRGLLQAWGEAALADGRGESIVAAMQESLDRDPLQEPVAELLVRALHEQGRSAEALSVFESTRRVLSDQLGTSPGQRLAAAHLQVLRQERTSRSAQPSSRARLQPLPVWMDTFVGRESEAAELSALLDAHRLVTVTGPGGAGKTRLSVEVAARLDQGAQEVDVCFIDATVLSDSSQFPQRVAATLGVDVLAGETADEALRGAMTGRDVLVIADNLEHLPGVGESVERLISAVPRLRFLATSRHPLGVGAEHRFPLRPLDVFAIGSTTSVASSGPAVTLFAERASAMDPGFRLDSSLKTVTEICRRLDGLPLAIELAAGWCGTLPLPSLLKQLDHTLPLLVAPGGSGRPDRQATLHATIEWSYDLLDDAARGTLRMLSVCRGGCTIESAGAICRAATAEVLPRLRDLVERGLLVAREGDTEQPRFEMLFTVREYALDRLVEDMAEDTACRYGHTAYYLGLADTCSQGLGGPEQVRHLDTLHVERDNIYEAISAALLAGDADVAISTAAGLWRFWQLRSHLDEGRRLLQMLDDSAGSAIPPVVRGRLSLALGSVRYWQLDYNEALSCYERAAATLDGTGDLPAQAEAVYDSGFALVLVGRLEDGLHRFIDAEQRYRELGDPRGQANARSGQALAAFLGGDSGRATTLAQEALAELRIHGDPFETANAGALVATTLRAAGRVDEAEPMLREAVVAFHAMGSVSGVAWMVAEMAALAFGRGNVRPAAVLAGAAESLDNSRHPRVPMTMLGLQDINRIRSGHPAAEQEWNRGRAMTIDEAVAATLATGNGC